MFYHYLRDTNIGRLGVMRKILASKYLYVCICMYVSKVGGGRWEVGGGG